MLFSFVVVVFPIHLVVFSSSFIVVVVAYYCCHCLFMGLHLKWMSLAGCSIYNSIQLLPLLFSSLFFLFVLYLTWRVFLSVLKSLNSCYSFSRFLSVATYMLSHLLFPLATHNSNSTNSSLQNYRTN